MNAKVENLARRRPDFEPGFADVEAAQFKKIERCRQAQIQWLSDEAKNQLLNSFRYKFNRKKEYP